MARIGLLRAYLGLFMACMMGSWQQVARVYAGMFTFCFKHFILLKCLAVLPTCHLDLGTYRTNHRGGMFPFKI